MIQSCSVIIFAVNNNPVVLSLLANLCKHIYITANPLSHCHIVTLSLCCFEKHLMHPFNHLGVGKTAVIIVTVVAQLISWNVRNMQQQA